MFDKEKRFLSTLRSENKSPTRVKYFCPKTSYVLGVVYKAPGDHWYLSTCYLKHWQPFEVFSKYQGYLFLRELHNRNLKDFRSG